MKISSKGEYGVMAMVDLAIHGDSGATKIKSIADRQKIPKKYLEQVLLDLKRGGLVKSTRGKNGGYSLAKTPEEINLLDLLDALEEHVSMVNARENRPDYLHTFWNELTDELREQLQIPLSEIVKRKEESETEMMYHI